MSDGRAAELLVVDDDDQLRDLLTLILSGEGYNVRSATDADTALREVGAGGLDLVVLDIGLGAVDGREVLAEIRRRSRLPVIMISAQGMPEDRIVGLKLGADDFLTKPFSPLELVARVESVLRRARPERALLPPPGSGLHIDERTREATVDGRRVELTAKEFDLLAFLATDPGAVQSRTVILENVWDTHWYGPTKTVDAHVAAVRKKLGDPRWIEAVRGVGFRFEEPTG